LLELGVDLRLDPQAICQSRPINRKQRLIACELVSNRE
jgi:hypothetical protein